jgi:L-ornithine Nalpha-acyltransferase
LVAPAAVRLTGRDHAPADAVAAHLLVLADTNRRAKVVAACRLTDARAAAARGLPLSTQTEFDVAALIARHPALQFVEVSRTCVAAAHRSGRALEALWQGLWAHVRRERFDVMIGCASLPGDDPTAHAATLRFLRSHRPPSPEWAVRGIKPLLVAAAEGPPPIAKAELRRLPPLLRGYLSLGAYIGPDAHADRVLGTTDVCVVLPVSRIDPRWFARFGAP